MIEKIIVKQILKYFNEIQAIYLFGSYLTEYENDNSDVDIALLFDFEVEKAIGNLSMHQLSIDLESMLGKPVDLINLNIVSTVFQKEIIEKRRRIYCKNKYLVETFEMLTISKYQKLNEERESILEEIVKSGRVLNI